MWPDPWARKRRAHRERDPGDVGVDHRPPVLDALLEEAALGAEAGVGEVGVHAAEALEGGGDEGLLVVPVGDVAAYGDGGVSAAELLGESGQLVLGAGREDHAVAELDRPPGGGGADAGAGACDNQDGFVGHGGVLAGGLGPEPLDPPAATCIGQVAEAVVEAAGAVLPELPGVWNQAIAAPVLADRQVAALVLPSQFGHALLEPLAARHRAALGRGERAHLAVARAAVGIALALLAREALDRPLHADLAAERGPVEEERGAWVRLELTALAAAVVGVEGEAALIDALREDHAGRGATVGRGGGKRDGLGLPGVGFRGGVEPAPEEGERVGIEFVLRQRSVARVGHRRQSGG